MGGGYMNDYLRETADQSLLLWIGLVFNFIQHISFLQRGLKEGEEEEQGKEDRIGDGDRLRPQRFFLPLLNRPSVSRSLLSCFQKPPLVIKMPR